MRRLLLWLAASVLLSPAAAQAQFDKPGKAVAAPPENGIRLDEQRVQRWKIGVVIRAPGNCAGVLATVPVPTDWPEQSVKLLQEEFSPQVRRVTYRVLDGGVRQMVIDIPQIRAGETATALVTLEVNRSSLRPPLDPGVFKLPNVDKLPKEVRIYLGPSPLIESRHPTITKLAKEVLAGKEGADAWTKVETIYDWVRDHVEYFEGPIKGRWRRSKIRRETARNSRRSSSRSAARTKSRHARFGFPTTAIPSSTWWTTKAWDTGSRARRPARAALAESPSSAPFSKKGIISRSPNVKTPSATCPNWSRRTTSRRVPKWRPFVSC